jgi:hypothetical protein
VSSTFPLSELGADGMQPAPRDRLNCRLRQ